MKNNKNCLVTKVAINKTTAAGQCMNSNHSNQWERPTPRIQKSWTIQDHQPVIRSPTPQEDRIVLPG